MGTPARDMALAKVAMVAARPIPPGPGRSPSPSWVGPGRLRTRVGGSGRHLPRPQCWTTRNQAIYWKVRALTEIAIVMTRADSDRSVRMSDEAERFARTIADQGTLRAAASTSAEAAVAQTDPVQAGQLLTEAEQYARAISSVQTRLEPLGEVALAAARTNPVQAEQVIGSLPPDAPRRAEVAMVAALTDPACGERIAVGSADRYLQALVRAVVAVRTDPANAGPLLEEAVEAAGHDPAHVAEIAVVVASTDPARADQVASTMKAGAGMTAGYWRARALADLANVCFGSGAR